MTTPTAAAPSRTVDTHPDIFSPPDVTDIQREFARFLARRYNAPHSVQLAGALAVRALDNGDTCLDLSEIAGKPLAGIETEFVLPALDQWLKDLNGSSAVSRSVDNRLPLVLTGSTLAVHRYHAAESAVAAFCKKSTAYLDTALPETLLETAKALFKQPSASTRPLIGGDLQCAASLLPFFFKLAVITGGPGTGKTTVLAKALLLQCEAARLEGKPLPVITLAAPTGKAAQRMAESIRRALDSEPVRNSFPKELIDHIANVKPLTIHRLLGIAAGRTARKNADNPLECDIAVVDECSMIDLLLMKALTDALSAHAKLVLIGDRHQLPSIEAGRVLADLCEWQPVNSFSPQFAQIANTCIDTTENAITSSGALSPVVELRHSYRFDSAQAIGRVAEAVNSGDSARALDILAAARSAEASSFCSIQEHASRESVLSSIASLYEPLLAHDEPREALAALDHAMVLTALNEGPLGRSAMNDSMARRFPDRHITPIIVTVNDSQRNLSNGDIGLLFSSGGVTKAWFAHLEKPLSRYDIPPHEQAFAITIHKSQGSEFDEIFVIVPDSSPVLSRELLYTALTRARTRCTIVGSSQAITDAVARRCDRRSGLRTAPGI